MRSSIARSGVRLAIALTAVGMVQGCAGLMNTRVGFLPTANSSSTRSMLSVYDKRSSHYMESPYAGSLLKAPEDRSSKPFWMY